MTGPNLTFFVEVELKPLEELFGRPEVVPLLAENGCAVSMGLLDLSPRRAAVVRELESKGIPVTGWLLLDLEDGYWLNADNADRARDRRHLRDIDERTRCDHRRPLCLCR